MGVFKISAGSDSINTRFVSFHTNSICNEISLYVIDLLNNQYYYQSLSLESSIIQKWSQNLRQTAEEYLAQLFSALKEQSAKSVDLPASGKQESSLQNIFEIDGECNLIWKQFFENKKIFGRKGKFCLVKKDNEEVLGATFQNLRSELTDKEDLVSQLEKENSKLREEHAELRAIAENSVTMKENFEREIYGKFAALLNTKKRKNVELRSKLQNNQEEEVPVPSTSTANSSSTYRRPPRKQIEKSDDEYDEGTDVDSADEADVPSSSALSKRKGSDSNTGYDKKKAKSAEEVHGSSQDFLNDSIQAELNVGSFSSPRFRRKF